MMSDIALHALTTVFTWCSTLWVNYGDFGAGDAIWSQPEDFSITKFACYQPVEWDSRILEICEYSPGV